ncbi:MAG: hypothetical protein NVSMB27_44050 [Ktedonobacteraceae bacterium]
MDLYEDLLSHPRVCYRQFPLVEGVQGRVAVEVKILSLRRKLVTGQNDGIVGVIAPKILKLGDVVPARRGSRWW